MSDPQDRPGFVLPRVPWFGEVRAQSCVFTPEWKARRQTEKVRQPARFFHAFPRGIHAKFAIDQDAQLALGFRHEIRPGGVAAR